MTLYMYINPSSLVLLKHHMYTLYIVVQTSLDALKLAVDYKCKTCELTAPKTQMTNMLMKKEMARAMVDSMELYLIPSFTSTGSFLEIARL